MVLQEPACGSKTLLQDMQEAYEKGLVSEEAITEAVERLMEVRIRLGMMKDYPSPYEEITYDKVECPEHVKLSVEAARRSLVLLKNENAFLPLDKNKIQTVAVIGPNANSRDALVVRREGAQTPVEYYRAEISRNNFKYSLVYVIMNLIGCTNEEQVEKSAPLSLCCV